MVTTSKEMGSRRITETLSGTRFQRSIRERVLLLLILPCNLRITQAGITLAAATTRQRQRYATSSAIALAEEM